MKQIIITIDSSDESIVGGEGWGNNDPKASINNYEDMILEAVGVKYPGYEIEISHSSSIYIGKVEIEDEDGDLFNDGNDVDIINEIISDIWQEFGWLVEGSGTMDSEPQDR
jgi:hypothetical protein